MKIFTLIFIITFTIIGCKTAFVEECSQIVHPDPIVGSYISNSVGKVVSINNEVCDVEETSRIYASCHELILEPLEYDEKLNCKYCNAYSSIVARRIICKSSSTTNAIIQENKTLKIY